MPDVIELDGAQGEGGGQILRSALTLAALTGQEFTLVNIRAGRSRPGLAYQHLAAVRAVAAITTAHVEGDHIGSKELLFIPGTTRSGHYRFDIGTAGATSLVLQTLIPPLALAHGASELIITGGTHVPWSPCYHYLDWHWRILLAQMGLPITLRMQKAGFYPQGGGIIQASLAGNATPKPIELARRGDVRRVRGLSAVANLPLEIAERQRRGALRCLRELEVEIDIEINELEALSRGTFLLLLVECEHSQACVFALGERGKSAERIAEEASSSLLMFLGSGAAVDPWIADQLLLPLAIAPGRSEIYTSQVTQHLRTNAAIIHHFLPVDIEIHGPEGKPGRVIIDQPNSAK